jgi:hypothetical protein
MAHVLVTTPPDSLLLLPAFFRKRSIERLLGGREGLLLAGDQRCVVSCTTFMPRGVLLMALDLAEFRSQRALARSPADRAALSQRFAALLGRSVAFVGSLFREIGDLLRETIDLAAVERDRHQALGPQSETTRDVDRSINSFHGSGLTGGGLIAPGLYQRQ